MPTISNAPMPMGGSQGFASGWGMGNQLIQNIMNRQKMQQQAAQFAQRLALDKQHESRLQSLLPLQKLLMQAQTKQAIGNAAKANALGSIYSGVLGNDMNNNGQQGNTIDAQTPATTNNPFGGYGMLENIFQPSENQFNGQQNLPEANNLQTQPTGSQFTPNYSALEKVITQGHPAKSPMDRLAGLPGFGKVDTTVQDGQLIKTYPSGKVTSTPIGAGPEEKKRLEGLGAYKAKAYGEANDSLANLDNIQSNLDYMVDTLSNHPDPYNIIGPMNKHLANFFGNPEDQAALGNILTAQGNIVLEAAKNIKGAFTGRDQTLINSMKPSATDPYFVFLGKMKGMAQLNRAAQKRLDLYAENLSKGIAPHKALSDAREKTDFNKVAPEISNFVEMAQKKEMLKNGKMPTFTTKKQMSAFLEELPVQQRMKMLQGGF